MKHSPLSKLIPAVALCLSSSLFSQQERQPDYNIQFYALSWDNPIDDLKVSSAQRETPVFVSNSTPSGIYRYTGPSPMSFYSLAETEGAIQPTKVIQAELPLQASTTTPVLLLFFKNNSGGTPYRVLPLPNVFNTSNTLNDEIYVLNMTTKRLALSLNNQTFQINPRQQSAIKAKTDESNNYRFRVAQETPQGWELSYSTIWTHDSNVRSIVFIVPDPQIPNEVRIRRYNVSPPQDERTQGRNRS